MELYSLRATNTATITLANLAAHDINLQNCLETLEISTIDQIGDGRPAHATARCHKSPGALSLPPDIAKHFNLGN